MFPSKAETDRRMNDNNKILQDLYERIKKAIDAATEYPIVVKMPLELGEPVLSTILRQLQNDGYAQSHYAAAQTSGRNLLIE